MRYLINYKFQGKDQGHSGNTRTIAWFTSLEKAQDAAKQETKIMGRDYEYYVVTEDGTRVTEATVEAGSLLLAAGKLKRIQEVLKSKTKAEQIQDILNEK